jgi:hypothetical protein
MNFMDLIEKSQVVHKSIHPKLKMLPPILSSDTTKSIRKVSCRKRGRILDGDPEFKGVVWAKALSDKKSETLAGPLDAVEWGYRTKWADGGDHFLLMDILNHGLVPSESWPQSQFSDEPPSLSNAMDVAKARGYKVPDDFLSKTKISRGEAELFYAAMYMVMEYRFAGFRWGKEDVLHRQHWRRNISCITGQFIIPDPLVEWKCPFVADQLWIINDGKRDVRLVVIEVDGAHHLEPARKEKDRKRDLLLKALHYEVIRVNEAWCKVDPFRVVAEILRKTELCLDFTDAMVGGCLEFPDDYICAACGKPMIRFEDDSIKEVFEGSDSQLVHKSCFDEILEESFRGDTCFRLTPQ